MDGARNALIVANYEYADRGLTRLRAPAKDAEELAEVLGHPDIGAFDVRTVINKPAHIVLREVATFFNDRRPDDLLLLHFSCHGVKDDSGELYLATADTRLDLLEATSVASDFVCRSMDHTRSRRVVLLLDCCYAGAFDRRIRTRGGTGVDINERLGGRGRAVITASTAMEVAIDETGVFPIVDESAALPDGSALEALEDDTQPSVFTGALVEGLRTGDADRDQDGMVSLDELYDYVYERVRERTQHQTPGKWGDFQGTLYIARRCTPVDTPSELPDSVREALENPLSSVRVAVVPELARMLNGEHQGLALAAREALTSLVATDDSKTVVAAASAALGTEPPPPPPPPPKPPPKPPPSGWRAWLRRNHRAVLASLAAVLLVVVIAGAVALWPESTTGAIPEEDLVVAFQTDDGVRLSRVDTTNGDVDVITSVDAGNQLLYPVVSPDRRQILYLTDSPTDDHSFGKVHIMNSDGSDDRELFGDQQCEYSSRPAFSNDGKRLAVVCMGSDGRSTGLYVADADGRNLESVLDSDALSRAPTWQRNQWIIYSELETDEPTGPAVLNRVHPDGSGDTPITAVNEDGQGGASFSDLDWSSSGGLLYIKRGLSLNASNHLKPGYVYTLADGSDQPVQEGPDLAASATWSPGGQKYVEVTAQGGGLVVRTPGSDSATTIDIDPSTGLQDARPNTPAWGSR